MRVCRRMLLSLTCLLAGCSTFNTEPISSFSAAQLEPGTSFTHDLADLPPPKGRIVAAVYGFKDQTGQNKTSPDVYSTAVTQGGASILVKALRDSKWFIPVERENLNDLITERKLIRQTEQSGVEKVLPSLMGAGIVIEGAIIGYDSNVKTGGAGARYLGISLSNQYRADQVTINLRAVDINTGQILHTVSTTKTVYSIQLTGGVYKFVRYKSLLETEVGLTLNEPAQIAVQEAIEAGVVNLIVEGIDAHSWNLANQADAHSPVLERYRLQRQQRMDEAPRADPEMVAESDADTAFVRKKEKRSVLPTAADQPQKKKKKKKKPVADSPDAPDERAFRFDEQ